LVHENELRLEGLVAGVEGREIIRDSITGNSMDGEKLGTELGQQLLLNGARNLLSG
jgi:hydroxymethylbilane synthase